MSYYIIQNNETKGPFTIGQLRTMWSSGAVTTETLYCRDGWSEWLPLLAMARELESSAVPTVQSVPVQSSVCATVRKRSSFVGGGCALQGLGLISLVLAAVTFMTIIGPIIFGILGLWLLIYGGRQASWVECSACGGNLSHTRVSLCPHCQASF